MSFLDEPNVESISDISTLLHLFAHRNSNQHRRSVWWRHFSIFRRQLGALEHDLKQLTAPTSTHVEHAKLKAEIPQIRTRIEQRVKSWPVSRWQHAFSQLTADGRFAQLGLFLLAVLAHVCTLTQLSSSLEALGEAELQQILLDFGREHWKDESNVNVDETPEDVGAAVARDQPARNGHEEAASLTRSKISSKQKIDRPRRRKKNAIDELFGSL